MIEYRPPMRQIALLILLSLGVEASAARRTASSITPEMDKLLMEGVDAIYQMDFSAADKAAEKAIALDPEFPHPYLGQAANDLIRFSYGSEQSDPKLVKSFEGKIGNTIKVAERWLKKNDPKNPDVLLVLGCAHGIAGRMAIVRRQWLKAFTHGRASMKSVRAAVKHEPELWDAYLGLGMFDYYVDTIPRFAGWLAKIMLGGDRMRGIEEVKISAEKGHYTKTAAQLILVEIFTEDRHGVTNTPEGVRLMAEIRRKYPDSAMLHSAQIVALYEDKQIDAALKEASEYQARVKANKKGYETADLSKTHAMLGTILWAAGDKARALEQFRAGAQPIDGLKTRWTVWSQARAGQVLDALGRRAEALEFYRAAYDHPDRWDYRALIKPCLKSPCVGAGYPGHFSPY